MPGIVHVIVFSNFEGFAFDPAPVSAWFDGFAAAHSEMRWTHMYNPRYLLESDAEYATVSRAFTQRLIADQARGVAEIGVHIHMYYSLMERIGVTPRAFPFGDDKSPGCDCGRTIADDPRGKLGGYDVMMTGYSQAERERIVDVSVNAFLDAGFTRPMSFCAGYSAADPALQETLAGRGFTTSFAAQALGPKDYGPCWYRLLEWYGRISPLTIPYRVARGTILPPPHEGGEYLDLVEVPLNMACDKNALWLGDRVVTREAMFDRHWAWAKAGHETAVAIGVHADILGGEKWDAGPVGPIATMVDGFLRHVAGRAKEGGAEVRYSTASEAGRRFFGNTTAGAIGA